VGHCPLEGTALIVARMANTSNAAPDEAYRRLAQLRGLTPAQYTVRAAAEGAALSLACSPVFLVFYFMDGLLVARYPRGAAALLPRPAAPPSFPALLSSASLYCLNCSLRTSLWVVLACGGSAALREGLGVGPRHQDPREALQDVRVLGAAACAGSLSSAALTWDWARAMGRGRYLVYSALGGLVGALMPDIFAVMGPRIKARLKSLMPSKGELA